MKRRGFLKQAGVAAVAPVALVTLPPEPAPLELDWLSLHRVPREGAADYDWRSRGPFGEPGSYFIYWWHTGRTARRAVYNIPAGKVLEIQARIIARPDAPYLTLVGDLSGAMYADEMAEVQHV